MQYNTTAGDGAGSSVICTTAFDEAGKPRQVCSDVLGRMVKVLEPNPGSVATNATGWVSVSGSEQSSNSQPATSGKATVTISGTEQSACLTFLHGRCVSTIWDTGTVTINVNGHATSANYGHTDTSTSVASNLASNINNDSGAFVTATASGTTITLTARTTGASTNYSFTTSSATSDTGCNNFCSASFFAAPASGALTGGQNASSTPDTGTITVTVSGTGYSTTYGAGDTSSTIAGRLAAVISSGSYASASASGSTINITSKTAGTAGDDSLSASYSWNSSQFTNPSFTTSTSGSSLTGALDAGAVNNNPFVTLYQYDTLGNMLRVDQKGSAPNDSTQWRTRTFTYNSLSQLLTATNPESGTVSYAYDAEGNVISKTAPAPNQTGSATLSTTYTYDALNRMTSKSYSDSTPMAYFSYDTGGGWGVPQTNAIGRLAEGWIGTSCCVTNGATIFGYDAMGRVIMNNESTPGISNVHVNYTYDLAGNMTTHQDGTSPVFTQAYDSAGRIKQLTSSLTDAQHPGTLATIDPTQGYFPNATLREVTYGNGLTETAAYNVRLQPCRMDLNSSGTVLNLCNDAIPSGSVQDYTFGYNLGTTNNGNVVAVSASGAQNFNRTYTYDQLNRLLTLSAPGDPCSGLSWTYDAWGNRTDQTVTGGSCNSFHQTVAANNRLSGAGYQYDSAGNMINDGTHSYTYDAENRIIQVDGGNTATYIYDAFGRRVRKTVGGAWTTFTIRRAEPSPNISAPRARATPRAGERAIFIWAGLW